MGKYIYSPQWKIVLNDEDITQFAVIEKINFNRNAPAVVKLAYPPGKLEENYDATLKIYLDNNLIFIGKVKKYEGTLKESYLYAYDLLEDMKKYYSPLAFVDTEVHNIISQAVERFFTDKGISNYTINVQNSGDAFLLKTSMSLNSKDLFSQLLRFADITGAVFYITYENEKYNFYFQEPTSTDIDDTLILRKSLGITYKDIHTAVKVLGAERADGTRYFVEVIDENAKNIYGLIYAPPINTNYADYDLLTYIGEKYLTLHNAPQHRGFIESVKTLIMPGNILNINSTGYKISSVSINYLGIIKYNLQENILFIDKQKELEIAQLELNTQGRGYKEYEDEKEIAITFNETLEYSKGQCTGSCQASCENTCEIGCEGKCQDTCKSASEIFCTNTKEVI